MHGAYHAKEQRPMPSTLLSPFPQRSKLSRVEGVGAARALTLRSAPWTCG